MNSIVVSIGSNISAENVRRCLTWLNERFTLIKSSSVYQTPQQHRDLDITTQAATSNNNSEVRIYSNAVAIYNCNENLEELNIEFKKYEKEEGRTPEFKKTGIVPVDIDVVIFNGEIIRTWDYNQRFFKIGFKEIIV
ncbi:MAG: 2-amino-4-hydroxy-6-hydroxymethyldihydropteridine diphosphokinase [Muribaculaceae bacterium]|nr:2-amino-4-hydroxy-6-hydroxymethyldihydropteridine diphosphokinase [Muribaculaceae bacterium]